MSSTFQTHCNLLYNKTLQQTPNQHCAWWENYQNLPETILQNRDSWHHLSSWKAVMKCVRLEFWLYINQCCTCWQELLQFGNVSGYHIWKEWRKMVTKRALGWTGNLNRKSVKKISLEGIFPPTYLYLFLFSLFLILYAHLSTLQKHLLLTCCDMILHFIRLGPKWRLKDVIKDVKGAVVFVLGIFSCTPRDLFITGNSGKCFPFIEFLSLFRPN